MTAGRLVKIKARAAVEEVKAKHWDGEEHHVGCGYGSSVCPGHPCWDFGRADVPDLAATLERAVELLRKEHCDTQAACPACVFVKEFDHDK